MPFELYINSLFIGINFLEHLKIRGYHIKRSLRANDFRKVSTLSDEKLWGKRDKKSGILLTRWVDNAILTLSYRYYIIKPITNVKRYSQVNRRIFQVTRPHIIGQDISNISGTDLMDENIAKNQISLWSKKMMLVNHRCIRGQTFYFKGKFIFESHIPQYKI